MISNGGVQAILVGLLLFSVITGSVAAVSYDDSDLSSNTRMGAAPLQVSPAGTAETNNSSVQHANPDEAGSDGDLDAVRQWLAGRMTQTLIDCTEQVATADRVACSRLDNSYPEWISKYVDVVGETPSQEDDSIAQEFNETRERQLDFIQSVNEYQETLDQYEQAKENGNDSRTRELARDLSEDAAAVNSSGSGLRGQYGSLSNETGANLSNTSETVAVTSENSTETAAEIRAQELQETSLQVTANRTEIAFDQPVELTGTLVTESGDPVSDQTMEFTIGRQRHRVHTNADGEFTLTYRPTLLALNQTSLRVAYQPRPTAPYGESTATVPIDVSQTNTTVTMTVAPQNASFGDSVRLTGTVRAAGTPVQNTPVSVILNGSEQRQIRTDSDGQFVANVSVPASLPAGNVTAQASLAVQQQALSRSTGQTRVEIRPTNTSLSLSQEAGPQSEPTLSGHLQTDSGTAVSGEMIRLQVNETTIGTLQTNATGQFETAINLSSVSTESITITAVYDPSQGNLEPARTQLELQVPPSSDRTDESGGLQSMLPSGIGLWDVATFFLVVFILGVGGVVVRNPTGILPDSMTGLQSSDPVSEGDSVTSDGATASAVTASRQDAVEEESAEAVLSDIVKQQLERGETDAAIITAYELLRRHVHEEFETDAALTHWELLASIKSDLTTTNSAGLAEFVDAYERAAFAPESVSHIQAVDVTAAVRDFVTQTD